MVRIYIEAIIVLQATVLPIKNSFRKRKTEAFVFIVHADTFSVLILHADYFALCKLLYFASIIVTSLKCMSIIFVLDSLCDHFKGKEYRCEN